MSQYVDLKKIERKLETVEPLDKALSILKEKTHGLILYIKNDIEKNVIQITNILEDNSIIIITDPNYQPEGNIITIYGLLDKYIEIHLDINETQGPGVFKCKVKQFKRAVEVRKELRLRVKPEQVIASGFMVSKHAIDITTYKIPTTIKVLLDQFHSSNLHMSDVVKVDVFDKSDSILENIRKQQKIFFVEDINNPETFQSTSEDIINIHELLGENLPGYIRKNIEKGYKSVIIAPIVYIMDSGAPVSFAYLQLISKSRLFTLNDIEEIKKMLGKLVNRIKDANTVLIQTNQEIVNLSKSGAKLYITDEELKKHLQSTKGFIFNIVFKLQAPVTIYCEIKNLYRDDHGNLFAGIAFAGHSSRKNEMKRYYSFLEPMIKNYKQQLLEARKKTIKQPVSK
ncbi:MAG: DUF1577 domain-containing protein [Spirochaetota bacterium]